MTVAPAGPIYLDASALLRLYVGPESAASGLQRTLEGRTDLAVSDLGVTEVVSALARRAREGTVEPRVVRAVAEAVNGHVEDGTLGRVELAPAVFRDAERLLAEGRVLPRAADAIHLAAARAAGARTICTYDVRQARSAVAVNLAVWPPPSK